MDWLDLKLIGSTLCGIALALFLSSERTWRERGFITLSGLFAAFFGTEPLMRWAGTPFSDDGWPYLIAGALALSGSRLARRAWQFIDNFQWPGGSK